MSIELAYLGDFKAVPNSNLMMSFFLNTIFPLFLIFLLCGAMLWVFYQSHPFQIPLPVTSILSRQRARAS